MNPTAPTARGGAKHHVAKHRIVRDRLEEIIREGGFEVGCRLPADRELALRFGVSYMTARQAVGELVEADLLERRIGDGTYVRAHTRQKLSQTTLNLICSAYGGSLQRDFLNLGGKLAEARGWKHHIIRLHPNHERPAVRAIGSGELALVLSDEPELEGPLGRALEKAAGRAILVGNRMDERGVPSVVADDEAAVRLAVAHLREAGHQNIGLMANHPESHNERVQIAAWRASFADVPDSKWEQRLIAARTPRFECPTHHAYQKARAWLSESGPQVSALICLGDELAIGVLAACRDENRSVPEAMSMVNLSDSSLMAYTHPQVTCVDVDVQGHIECALRMLDSALQNKTPQPLCLIAPRLIQRRSVARLNHAAS